MGLSTPAKAVMMGTLRQRFAMVLLAQCVTRTVLLLLETSNAPSAKFGAKMSAKLEEFAILVDLKQAALG